MLDTSKTFHVVTCNFYDYETQDFEPVAVFDDVIAATQAATDIEERMRQVIDGIDLVANDYDADDDEDLVQELSAYDLANSLWDWFCDALFGEDNAPSRYHFAGCGVSDVGLSIMGVG